MTNLVNIWAETNADLIGDDSTPTLTIKNTSTGYGLSIDTTSGTGAAIDLLSDNTTQAARVRSAAAGAPGLLVGHSVAAAATVAPITLAASTASQAVIAIQGVFMSTASLAVAADNTAFIIPVYHQSEAVWGYLAASTGLV